MVRLWLTSRYDFPHHWSPPPSKTIKDIPFPMPRGTPYSLHPQLPGCLCVAREGSGGDPSILGEVSQYNLYLDPFKRYFKFTSFYLYTTYTLNMNFPRQKTITHPTIQPTHNIHPQLAKVLLQPRWLLWMLHWPLLLQWHFSRLRPTMQVAPVAVQGAGRQRPAC